MVDENFETPEEYTPEEAERAERLFAKLAAEEPPLDLDNDTAPSKTAPRNAVSGDTRPMQARGKGGRYITTLAMGIVLVVTLMITILIFVTGDDESPSDTPTDNAPTAVVENPIENPTQLQDPPTPVPTTTKVVTPTTAPTDEPQTPVQDIAQFQPDILPPTAAADVQGAWLLTPIAPVDVNVDTSIGRQENPFTIAGESTRLEVVPYQIVSGDTLSGIASRFGLDVCTIVWSNPLNKVSPLRPGNTIDIMPVDGVLFKVERNTAIKDIAEKTAVDPYEIIDSPYNDLFGATPDSVMVEGMKLVIPDGDGGNCNVWSAPTSSSGGVAGGGRGGGSLWGCGYTVENGAFAGITPVAGRYEFFQGFSAAHSGVDLSASTGTPVVAAGSGAVAFAGWNDTGYGNAIVIDHGGIYTLYGHLSSINVTCGQNVGAGDTIGAVGSTGRSSGPHLHFEIRDAGFNPVDPTYSIRL